MRSWSIVPLRIGLGVVFVAHGLQMAFGLLGGGGIRGVSKMLAGLGFAPPFVWAYLVAYVQFLCGLFVLLGVFTRISSILLFIVMLVATITVHAARGFFITAGGFEYNFVIMAVCVSLILSGPGKLSVNDRF